MRVQTIVYVSNMASSRDWYTRVLATTPSYESDMWTPFAVGDAVVALHWSSHPAEGSRCELSLVTIIGLDEEVSRLEKAGVDIERGIIDETFGRSILLRDPDGTPIQVNEHS